MKILSSEEMQKADAYTIEYEPIKSIDLMERAAKECEKWLTSPHNPLFPGKGGKEERVVRGEVKIVCGLGNNGGDGLAIARLLSKKFNVEVLIIRYSDKCSADFLINEKRLKKIKKVKIHNITSS